MGTRFESHALTLLPVLFGVVVITVAVMAESADQGVRTVLRHCQTPRILQVVSDGVCKEKNPKTRQFCAGYIGLVSIWLWLRTCLLSGLFLWLSCYLTGDISMFWLRVRALFVSPQILEEWDVSVWTRNTEGLEAALRAAAQDSVGDTRASARTAMALYNSAQPERAHAFLRRLDSSLQDKLSAALGVTAKPGANARCAVNWIVCLCSRDIFAHTL